jgi:sodium-coupled neutral amino acid transporter 7/8
MSADAVLKDPLMVPAGVKRSEESDPNAMKSPLSPSNPRNLLRHELEDVSGENGTIIGSACVMIQSIIGGGLLAFPSAYKTGGIAAMVTQQAILMVFIAAGLRVLAYCAEQANGADSYQLLMRRLLGRRAEAFCNATIILLIFGACVVYLDIIMDQLHSVIQFISDKAQDAENSHGQWYLNRQLQLILVTALVFCLCLVKQISKLAGASLFGFVAMMYVAIVVVSTHFTHPPHDHVEVHFIKPSAISWLSVLPTICFGFQGHIAAIPLYAELRGRSLKKFDSVIALTLTACLVVYNITGWIGYLSFGDDTDADILKNLDENSVEVVIARVAVAVSVVTTYAILHFCARKSIIDEYEGWMSRRADSSQPFMDNSPEGALLQKIATEKSGHSFFLAVTIAWNTAVLLVALAVPDIGKLVSIMGNLCAFFMFQVHPRFVASTPRALTLFSILLPSFTPVPRPMLDGAGIRRPSRWHHEKCHLDFQLHPGGMQRRALARNGRRARIRRSGYLRLLRRHVHRDLWRYQGVSKPHGFRPMAANRSLVQRLWCVWQSDCAVSPEVAEADELRALKWRGRGDYARLASLHGAVAASGAERRAASRE